MNVSILELPFPAIIIDGFYDNAELELINSELDELSSHTEGNPFFNKEESFNAVKDLKDNKSLFLDNYYSGRRHESRILSFNRKLFPILNDLKENVSKDNWFFGNLVIEDDYTLISYYDDGGHFLPHRDKNILTSLTWLFNQPKKFTGGDLTFPDYDTQVECVYNRMIAFPGMIRHEVDRLSLPSDVNSHGRWCITQFAHQSKQK